MPIRICCMHVVFCRYPRRSASRPLFPSSPCTFLRFCFETRCIIVVQVVAKEINVGGLTEKEQWEAMQEVEVWLPVIPFPPSLCWNFDESRRAHMARCLPSPSVQSQLPSLHPASTYHSTSTARLQVLRKLHHPNIISLHHAFLHQKSLYIIMEHAGIISSPLILRLMV